MLAVKPFVGVVKNSIPSDYKPSARDGAMPEAELDLEYVFGYRSHDVRNNLRYTKDGRLVYHAAGVGIVMDQRKNVQEHFIGHSDDIHCLALDHTGSLAATGEIGPKPLLAVWNCLTMKQVASISSKLKKGIQQVAWSADGRLLAAADMSVDHCVQVWDVSELASGKADAKPVELAYGKGLSTTVLSLGFNTQGDGLYATGVRSVCQLSWANGALKSRTCSGWGTSGAETVLSQATIGNTTFTGTKGGEIVAWTGRSLAKKTKAHTGKVNALSKSSSGKELLSGG